MKAAAKIFNRRRLLINRERALASPDYREFASKLYNPSTLTVIDHISTIKRDFKKVAYMGQDPVFFLENMPESIKPEVFFLCDIHKQTLMQNYEEILQKGVLDKSRIVPLVIDEELWCFKKDTLDLIVSNLNLHWVNDLQVSLVRFLDSLLPDGVLVGSIFGENTLQELRIAFILAELERSGGVSQHVSPFVSISEMGNLLTRCQYTIPSVFTEKRSLLFDSSLNLMQFLKTLGESSALTQARSGALKETIIAAAGIYDTLFKADDKVEASVEEIFFIGWKFHPDQQKPLKRGSGEFTMKSLEDELRKLEPEEAPRIKVGHIEEEEEAESDKAKKPK